MLEDSLKMGPSLTNCRRSCIFFFKVCSFVFMVELRKVAHVTYHRCVMPSRHRIWYESVRSERNVCLSHNDLNSGRIN